jgi:hypothetical protein
MYKQAVIIALMSLTLIPGERVSQATPVADSSR